MKYAKLKTGTTLTLPPLWVFYEEQQIFNPSADVLIALGYKPVIETPYPAQEDDAEPIAYSAHYEEREGEIVLVWEVVEPPTEETEGVV